MTLPEKIVTMYPELASSRDFVLGHIVVRDDSDGKGAYIAKWDHPTLPRPTQAQLDAIEA